MSSDFVKDVMESMGWTDGKYIPIANDINKKLLAEISFLMKSRDEKETLGKEYDEREVKLEHNMKNTEIGIEQNLKVLNSHSMQLTHDRHALRVLEREVSKMNQDLRQMAKDMENMNKQQDTLENEIARTVHNINERTGKIKWAQCAMVEWTQAMDKGEETNNLIQKYCKEDTKKALTLDAKRRFLQETVFNQRKHLIELNEESKSLEKAIDRSANLYRQVHVERRYMVRTWKEAVGQMNQLEADIAQADHDIEKTENLLKKKELELKEQDDFLQQLINTKNETQAHIDQLNSELSRLRNNLLELQEFNVLKHNEVAVLRKTLNSELAVLSQQRRTNRQKGQEKIDKENLIYKMDDDYILMQERFKKVLDKHLNSTERLQMFDDMCEGEGKIQTQFTQEMSRLNVIMYKTQQQLLKLKDEHKLLMVAAQGLEASITSTKATIKTLQKQIDMQTENDYSLGLRVQIYEIRIANLQGSAFNPDEQLAQNQKIQQLEAHAENSAKTVHNIKQQIDKLEDDTKNLTNCFYQDKLELEALKLKAKERSSYLEGGEKSIKSATATNQEKIVELNILKIRVNEMEREISKHNDNIYTLDKHRADLEKAMEQRMITIQTQMDILKLKRKGLSEENGALKMDLGERDKKITILKKRYENDIELLGKNEDGTPVTGVQVRIETAQEKQMLLQDGNELNDKVLKAEKDIKQMENTLMLINFTNCSYRRSFENITQETPEMIQLKELQEEYCKTLNKLKALRVSFQQRQDDIDKGIKRREILEKDIDEMIRIRTEHNDILMKLQKEVSEQSIKLQRAEREIKNSQKIIYRKNIDVTYLNWFEKELVFKELEEKNVNALQLYADLEDSAPDIGAELRKMLCYKDIKIPLRKARSQTSWRSEYSDCVFMTSNRAASTCVSIQSPHSSSNGSARPSVVSIDFGSDLNEKKCEPKRKCAKP